MTGAALGVLGRGYADNVEVTGSHVGLAFNRKAYRALGKALASPAA